MSKVLSLALKINADSSGLKLDPVERALKRLGDETDKVTKVFDKFASTSEVAAKAQQDTAKALDDLTKARKAGTISAEEFAREFERISEAAGKEAAALERAAKITEANLTPLERFTRAQKELKADLDAGRITTETYTRALEGAAKGLTDAERAAQGLSVAQKDIESAAANTTLKFNELSGVFAVLPGPLGNIAGRISGIASASEGLSRIFAGGLRSGISNLVGSFTSLVNPLTAAVAGIAAFGAAATSVVSGLVRLEDRVERLGNLANQLGVSFEFVQVLEEAGKRTGVSIDAVSSAFGRLQRTLAEGGEEADKANKALGRLGLSVEDLSGLSEQQKIELIGKQIAAIEDPAQRSAAAIALFGRSGIQLLPFFNNLETAADAVERFGSALNDVDKQRIDDLGRAFDDVGTSLTALGQELLLPFAGLTEGLANLFADLIGSITNLIRPIGDVITPLLDTFGESFGELGKLFFNITSIIGTVISAGFTPLRVAFEVLGPAINPITGALRAINIVLEQVIGFVNRTAEAINNALQRIPFIGRFFKSSADEAKTAIGELRDEAEDPIGDGLSKGFERTLESIRSNVSKAVDESAKFGQAGFDAALQYQTAIEDLKSQLDRGLINEEVFRREAEKAKQAFDGLIDSAKKATAEAEKQAAAVQRIIDSSLEQQRIENEFGGDSGRFRAAQNLLAIQEEIVRVEEQLQAARAAGDQAAINALTSRLATLDQVAARENDIASGARKQREEAAREAERAAREAERGVERAAKEAERIVEQRRKAEERINKQIEDSRLQLLERQFEIERDRAEELANIRTGSIKVGDLRSGGISAFFDTLKEDPAVAEAKKQTRELEKLNKNIAKLEAEKVEILAGTG